jgi:hypothetical protein
MSMYACLAAASAHLLVMQVIYKYTVCIQCASVRSAHRDKGGNISIIYSVKCKSWCYVYKQLY